MKPLVDIEAAKRVANLQFAPGILRTYGREGTQRLRLLTRAIADIHEVLAYELMREGLTIFATINDDARPLGEETREVDGAQLPTITQGAATIQVLARDRYLFLPKAVDPLGLADQAVVYHYADADHFVIDGTLEAVENQTGFPSVFAIPTFCDLDAALRHYRDHRALYSQCPILRTCWHDEHRWLFVAAPEAILRNSLHDSLRLMLRGHKALEVRGEQQIDDEHRPDIKVTWTYTNRIAYIEIKWMGKSLSDAGKVTRYGPVRARKGAGQLAVYLAKDNQYAPQHQRAGYLVVFDARRWGVGPTTTDLSDDDALHFEHDEVAYTPDYREYRHDFQKPLRFYLRPALKAELG